MSCYIILCYVMLSYVMLFIICYILSCYCMIYSFLSFYITEAKKDNMINFSCATAALNIDHTLLIIDITNTTLTITTHTVN